MGIQYNPPPKGKGQKGNVMNERYIVLVNGRTYEECRTKERFIELLQILPKLFDNPTIDFKVVRRRCTK